MSKPLAILYFNPNITTVAKQLADAIRLEGNLCNLVYAGQFSGDAQVQKCEAIMVQEASGSADKIVEAYRRLLPETEIHFFNDEGEFEDGGPSSIDPPADSESTDETTDETSSSSEPAEDSADDDTKQEEASDDEESEKSN